MEEGEFGYDYQRGHESGIIIAKHAPEMADKIMKLSDNSRYVIGLLDGLRSHEQILSESHDVSIELKSEALSSKSEDCSKVSEKIQIYERTVAYTKDDSELIKKVKAYVEEYKRGFKQGYISARFTPDLCRLMDRTDTQRPFIKGFLDGERDHEMDIEEAVVYWEEAEASEKNINDPLQDKIKENKYLPRWMQKDFNKRDDLNKDRDIDHEPER